MTFPATVPAQLGRYRIVRPLGQGGMGSVYLAEDTVLRRRVALKVPLLDRAEGEAMQQRFYREARSAAAIKHPNVCPILDVGEANGLPFLVMELLEGRSLAEVLGARQPWPAGQAAALVRKLALAVGELHRCGLVHRDLKPGNVMLRPDGEPVLLDFGLARPFAAQSRPLTAPGASVGTPAYMAPEQVRGDNNAIGPATDVYALGVILYELLTGTLPFEGPPVAVFGQILHGQPEAPSARRPALDAGLDVICLRALAKDPGQRFASAEELAGALATFVESGPLGTTEVVAAGQPSAFGETLADEGPTLLPDGGPRRRRVLAWVVGILLLAGLLAAGVALWPKGNGEAERRAEEGREKDRPPEKAAPGAKQPRGGPGEIINSLGMKLVLVKPGRFQMGCSPGEHGLMNEKPQHWVAITRPFYIGAHEVTQQQYREVTGKEPSSFTAARVGLDTSRFPVENVSWDDAVKFCRLLSEKEKDIGRRYRLPTEAEWEYAARGGHEYKGSAEFHFRGPTRALDADLANFDGKFPFGGAAKKPSPKRPVPVGSYQPNALGLYDMHGNVWEWCADSQRTYGDEEIKDPDGGKAERRAFRGGSWDGPSWYCRAACRASNVASHSRDSLGFRVVCALSRDP